MHTYNTHEARATKIMKFMGPGARFQALGRGKYGHIVNICLNLRKPFSLLP